RKGAVTVATNMAGRGTDIMLGGNPEFRAVAALKNRGLSPEETPAEYEAAWDEALAAAEKEVAAEHEEVTELGGLYVLGTERHESRRIDNQLRGRSGRQGDPGESRFYLSLQDDLMRMFNAGLVDRFMTSAGMEDSVPIESKLVSRSIQSAQTQVEGRNFDIRKNVLKYDDVMNTQRKVIYGERRRVLHGEDMHDQMRHFITDTIDSYVGAATADGFSEDWDLETLWTALGQLYPISITLDELDAAAGGRQAVTREMLREELASDALHAFDERTAALGEDVMRQVERRVVLAVLDRKWREHLYEMDYLQEGIGLRAMAQKDPVVEYSREGYQMFTGMLDGIKEESVGFLFNVEVEVAPPVTVSVDAAGAAGTPGAAGAQPEVHAKGLEEHKAARLHYSAPADDGSVQERDEDADGTAVSAAPTGGSRAERRAAKKKNKRG
ncbi:MAG: preprotein translocase subunit SecA, partial [Austwickia sp.]|nr:preprotein translocase subunit SecA [Austwickia sp.]